MVRVHESRVLRLSEQPVRENASCVLYWMTAARRTQYSFALEQAAGWSRELGLPLLVLEALRCGYQWASDRIHQFVLDGMGDNAAACAAAGVRYYPYVEPERGAGRGLLEALAEQAAVIVTDDYPCFFLPRMTAAAAERVPVLMEAVDGNGLFPMRATTRVFPTAYAFRRHLQKALPEYLDDFPRAQPLKRAASAKLRIPKRITERWPPATAATLKGGARVLATLPVDHEVATVDATGGSLAARRTLSRFLGHFDDYLEGRNRPEDHATSGLSPYLHFGHISAHEVFGKLMQREEWCVDDLAPVATGKRTDWWGVSEGAEAFLDQLVTWRELGFNGCAHMPNHDRFESLPDWAQATLAEHAADVRDPVYTLAQFESAATHDPLWNAAQTQLVREGVIHNYLRMLWGKKILHWSQSPRHALDIMIELNNKYALDGRDPNSYSGIFWVLGRYDRPWGPERPIFGKVRYMTSENTARKYPVREYLREYAPA